jgi:hypothetical protein
MARNQSKDWRELWDNALATEDTDELLEIIQELIEVLELEGCTRAEIVQ